MIYFLKYKPELGLFSNDELGLTVAASAEAEAGLETPMTSAKSLSDKRSTEVAPEVTVCDFEGSPESMISGDFSLSGLRPPVAPPRLIRSSVMASLLVAC